MKKALIMAAALCALPVMAHASSPDSKIVGIGLNYDKLDCAGLVADKSVPVVDFSRLTDSQFVVVIVANNDPGHAIAYSFKDLGFVGLDNEIQALGRMQIVLDVGDTPRLQGLIDHVPAARLASIESVMTPPPTMKIEGVGDIIQAMNDGSAIIQGGGESGIKTSKKIDVGSIGHINMARGDDSDPDFGIIPSKKKGYKLGAGHQSTAAMQTDQTTRRFLRHGDQASYLT